MQIHTGIIRRCEQSFLREHLMKYHIKPVDSVVLHMLKKHGRCNQEALCSIIDIDKGRMARIMERLEGRQLIRRIVNPTDKREKMIEVTNEGMNMIQIIDSLFEKWNERCFTGFTKEEREQYQSYLERIAKNAMTRREIIEHD